VACRPRADPGPRRCPTTVPIDLDDPHDTRPSRARALRRAGVGARTRSPRSSRWTCSSPRPGWARSGPSTRPGGVCARSRGAPRDHRDHAPHATGGAEQPHGRGAVRRASRTRPRHEGRRRLEDPTFATGLGSSPASSRPPSTHALLTVRRPGARGGGRALARRDRTSVAPSRVRVLLRLAPQVAGRRGRARLGRAAGAAGGADRVHPLARRPRRRGGRGDHPHRRCRRGRRGWPGGATPCLRGSPPTARAADRVPGGSRTRPTLPCRG
jgi:hypothetical protein